MHWETFSGVTKSRAWGSWRIPEGRNIGFPGKLLAFPGTLADAQSGMPLRIRAFRLLPLVLVFGLVAAARADVAAPERKKVEKADDLPRHTYLLKEAPSVVLGDPAAIAALAADVQKDIDSDVKAYDIEDRTTLQGFAATELSLAMLNNDYPAALKKVSELQELQDKPSSKLTTGLTSKAWATAHLAATGDFAAAFQAAIVSSAQALPYDLVQNDLKALKGSYEIRTPSLLIGTAQQQFDPAAAKTGAVSESIARTLVAMNNQIVNLLPYRKQIVAALNTVISAHTVVKPDLWTPRLVTLGPGDKGRPVRIGIWDSGVDIGDFQGRVFTDEAGHHGFAYTLHDDPTPDLLAPLGDAQAHADELIGRIKGFSDLTSGIDSPEATEVKKYMSGLKPDQVKPTMEGLEMIAQYAHGTHVTGIAAAGNPYAQIVIGRLTFDYHMIPEVPTVEQAQKDAGMYKAAVAYFRDHGVRVVNMSWGGSLKDVEDALEANGAGGDAQARKKLARQIYDIGTAGLREALESAPGILFVVAAGNSNDNVKFDEMAPSSFQLANMISVGAVDEAGEETSFSSFGPMVNVHANGYEVESDIPGGKRVKLSGTSMASPEVTNLAGKLFALDPALTPEEAKALIVEGCDQNGRVNLVSEVKSIALLRAKLAAK
jgi:subtilisin family serine protease